MKKFSSLLLVSCFLFSVSSIAFATSCPSEEDVSTFIINCEIPAGQVANVSYVTGNIDAATAEEIVIDLFVTEELIPSDSATKMITCCNDMYLKDVNVETHSVPSWPNSGYCDVQVTRIRICESCGCIYDSWVLSTYTHWHEGS